MSLSEIRSKLESLSGDLDKKYVDVNKVIAELEQQSYPDIKSHELDRLASEILAHKTTLHPDYARLAGRMAVSSLHKQVPKQFSTTILMLREHMNEETGKSAPLIDSKIAEYVMKNKAVLDAAIRPERDLQYNYFGLRTLERSYLLKVGNKTIETPQYLLMRLAVQLHYQTKIEDVLETYEAMSQGYYIHASPTLFHASMPRPQLCSCFLLQIKDDSIEGIYDTLKQCAIIGKYGGGIGLSVNCIRSTGSYIAGTNGRSNGLISMLRVYDNSVHYVDQGGNKRPGACAIYVEPWHSDIFDFLDLKKPTGKDEKRARNLFYGLWIPDLFMKRVEANENWTLFSPNMVPGLAESYGEEFESLYTQYEKRFIEQKSPYIKVVKAQKLWYAILEAQFETGNPYMLYKDACNRKSNQKNLGTIQCSNLCTEVTEYTSPDEVAVCNLASLSLPMYVDRESKTFNFKKLHEIAMLVCRNLNRVIDLNYYPIPEAKRSNLRHRPIGIGVQGLAETFILMRYPYDSPEARKLNIEIFETIYHAALTASHQLSVDFEPYSTFDGSPLSKGQFQFDLWEGDKSDLLSGRWDWQNLREKIVKEGVRNSLLIAPMPTASTAQIMGNTESFEPLGSNMYTRRVLAGEFLVVNQYLIQDLDAMGLWNEEMRQTIISHDGNIGAIEEIPLETRNLYKTAWEIPQRVIIDMAVDRGKFICQSQSLNIHLKSPTHAQLTSMHFYGWKKGLKTGMYYLRTKAAVHPVKFTIDHEVVKRIASLGIQETEDQKSHKQQEQQEKEKQEEHEEETVQQKLTGQLCELGNFDCC